MIFDAAPNPQATIVTPVVEKTEPGEIAATQDIEATSTTESASTPIPEDAELPLTGTNPIIFIIVS